MDAFVTMVKTHHVRHGTWEIRYLVWNEEVGDYQILEMQTVYGRGQAYEAARSMAEKHQVGIK
jgi:hypothetical protein